MNDLTRNLDAAAAEQILRELYAAGAEQPEHYIYRDRIPEMVERVLTGADLEREAPEFLRHMKTCELCGSEFEDLLGILRADAEGSLIVAPPPMPSAWARVEAALAPDLAPERDTLWHTFEEGLQILAATVRLKIAAGRLLIEDLPNLLAPFREMQAMPAGLRSPAGDPEQLQIPQLLFPLREEGARVRIVPGMVSDNEGTLLVQIDDSRDSSPQPQVRVSLLDDAGNPLERLYTDADGVAIFKELTAGHYLLQVDLGRGYKCPFVVR